MSQDYHRMRGEASMVQQNISQAQKQLEEQEYRGVHKRRGAQGISIFDRERVSARSRGEGRGS